MIALPHHFQPASVGASAYNNAVAGAILRAESESEPDPSDTAETLTKNAPAGTEVLSSGVAPEPDEQTGQRIEPGFDPTEPT